MRYTYKDIEVMATALIMQLEVDERDIKLRIERTIAIIWDLLRIFAAANEPLLSKEQ